MITRKRINNDIYIRWAIFSPDGTPVDLALATIKKIQARAKVDGSIYNLLYNKEGNFLNVEFPAANQKDYGIHNLYLEYTVEDASTETGFRTFTMDYNNAFELVPISCELLEPQSDPIVIQGIIASFTYSMLSNAEKNDLASRLGSGEPYINLTASSLLIKRNKAGVYTPSTVTISSRSNNTEISKWTVSANGAAAQEITEESSPYAEISLQDNVITIVADSSLKEYYTIRATDGILYDYVTINTVKDGTDGTDGEDGVGTDGKNSSTGFVYRLSIEAPDTPTDRFIPPTGWSKNMPTPSGLQRVWLSTISIEENELVGAWSDPIPISGINGEDGEDGTDIEFIYKLTTKYEAPELPESIQDDEYEESEDYDPEQEYIPEDWTDNPLGISAEAQFEWICVRYKKKGIWTAYQGPTLWSRWGVKGMDGDGIEYIFTRTSKNEPPALPANSEEDIEWPVSGWTDNPEGIDLFWKYEWVSTRKKYEDGWGNFTTPAIWAAYGPKGEDGVDGDSTQTIYRRTNTDTPPSKPATSQEDFYIPTDWSLYYTGVTDVWTHEWVCTRTKTGGIWGEYVGPGIYSKYSKEGGPGQQGLAGCVVRTTEWALNIEYRNDEALVSDSTRWIDVVILINADGDFDVYKCISTHTSSEISKPGIGAYWDEYWEKFNTLPPIYTPMIMAPHAVLRFTQTHELTIEDTTGNITAGMSGKGNIRFWAGGETPASAKIKIYASGDIEGENYYLRADGSGYLAGHNISWDASGKTTFRGNVESNALGDKVVIDTKANSGTITGVDSTGKEMFRLGFNNVGDSVWKNSAAFSLYTRSISDPVSKYIRTNYSYGSFQITSMGEGPEQFFTSIGLSKIAVSKTIGGSNIGFSAEPGYLGSPNTLRVSMKGLPTSNRSLVAGDIWSDNGTLKIVK